MRVDGNGSSTLWNARLLALAAAFAASALTARAQTTFHGLEPGVATRTKVEQALGAPVKDVSATLAESRAVDGADKLFVQFRAADGVAERLELVYLAGKDRASVAASLGLPASPSREADNDLGKLEAQYDGAAVVLTHRGQDAGSPVNRVAYYGRERYAAIAGKGGGRPPSTTPVPTVTPVETPRIDRTPPPPPPPPTRTPARPGTAGEYVGCFKDTSAFDLDGYLERSSQNTPQRCIRTCLEMGC